MLFTDPPLTGSQLSDQLQPREATADPPEQDLTTSLVLPGTDVSVDQAPVPGSVAGESRSSAESDSVRVQVSFRPPRLGMRTFPPSVEGRLLDPPDLAVVRQAEQRLLEELNGNAADATPEQLQQLEDDIAAGIRAIPRQTTEPYIPEHLPLHPEPEPLPRELEAPKLFDAQVQFVSANTPQATTVFPPENRQVLWDTAYPWGTNGLVTTASGSGSGVLVGPRHLLTCSHVIVWNADGTCGWVDFTPGYFDRPPGPFGSAGVIQWYAHRKVTGPDIDVDEGRHDYCVLVLDSRLGDVAGWMGSKAYNDGWDGNAWWTHVGYPADFPGRPTWQSGIAMDGDPGEADSNQRVYHFGDVIPGQSGGAVFGWWAEGPHAVLVQSAHTPTFNQASGGSFIPDLIQRARSDFP